MGYLSQKKHKIRETAVLQAAAALLALTAVILTINSEFTLLGLNIFHFYCLALIFWVAACKSRKIIPAVVLGCTAVVIYILLAIAGNIFLSDEYAGEHRRFIDTQDDWSATADIKGSLLTGKYEFGRYAVINGDSPLLVLQVDLSGVARDKYPVLLKELSKFVIKQDMPAVVFGDFAMPAWAKEFRDFSESSGLKVKNRLIFGKNGFNIFALPQFYILGFNHMGIADLKTAQGQVSFNVIYDIL
ncbi:MAG: hypothetical protein IJ184_01720 [Alphaproteobacteria bacterium]|nr:hypothetical protein [Alphaproteobacteria bacterium]